jgi:NAD(P)-dependent dehydrogenase (short-subunit alcohol dehydrogenase family)
VLTGYETADEGVTGGHLFYDLAMNATSRLAHDTAHDLRPRGVTALSPGFTRTEAIVAASKRNADHVAAGVATFQTATPTEAAFGDARFDKSFAVNVGMFWRQRPVRDLSVLRGHLAPGGRLFLFHESPPGSTAPPDAGQVPALLEEGGFALKRASWPS